MNYNDLILGMKRFGSTEEDICINGLGISKEFIKENVIIAPWWEPSVLPKLGEAKYLSPSDFAPTKVWNIKYNKTEISYIKTGIGAPVLMDSLLSLGVSKCKRIIFIGSVGSLDRSIGIGDIVIPEYSICGDGASRYISSKDLYNDIFGEKACPDKFMFDVALSKIDTICKENNVKWHIGRTFSIDTVFAQFAHIDAILDMGVNSIEMETASAFRAARLMNIPIIALLSTSDNTMTNKSLVSGRTSEEMEYRKFVRRELFPQIILSVFSEVGGNDDY